MMKKILLSGLLSSTMLLAVPGNDPRYLFAESVDASLTCEDSASSLITNNDQGAMITASRKRNTGFKDFETASGITSHIGLPGTTNHNGTNETYGWVSFEVPVKAYVKITPSAYNVEPNSYRWIGLFDSQCTGRAIATVNYAPDTGADKNIEMMLEAGTYKLAIHDKDVANYASYLTQVTYLPEGYFPPLEMDGISPALLDYDPKIPIVGGASRNDSKGTTPYYEHSKELTLSLTHATSWKGQVQRYGWYDFSVGKDSHVEIDFTASNSGSSWLGIYKEDGTLIADQWTAKGTTGHIKIDLPAGDFYKFFLNKSGDDIANVGMNLNITYK